MRVASRSKSMQAFDRMATTLDQTAARIDRLLDTVHEQQRRDEILAGIERDGIRLDCDGLVHSRS